MTKFTCQAFGFVVAIAVLSSPAMACTVDDINAKATELSAELQKLAATDQNRALSVTQRMQKVQAAQANPGSMQDACKLYDDLLAEARK